jgi:hypothetical protein
MLFIFLHSILKTKNMESQKALISKIRKTILIVFALFCFFESFAQLDTSKITLPLSKAFIEPDIIDAMLNDEVRFRLNDSLHAPSGKNWFEFMPGNSKVLVVAPHATSQVRNGNVKRADSGTGSLAITLNKLNNCPLLFTTYLSPSDPNYYDDNAFKDSLKKLLDQLKPVIVIDLHASNPYRPYDVDFGTMNGASFLDRIDLYKLLIKAFYDNGLNNLSQDRFAADRNQTVTKYVKNKNIPCLQLEINSTWFPVESSEYLTKSFYAHRGAQLLQAISSFIKLVDSK